jgi:lipopolysaccharide/colanic/teichoic acid biosynthesis glycosyltransferase
VSNWPSDPEKSRGISQDDGGASGGAWMSGFHGAIVDLDGLSPQALRQLAMSHRSTGFGRIRPLVELPVAAPLRLVPTAAVGARAAAHDRDRAESLVAGEFEPPAPRVAPDDERAVGVPGSVTSSIPVRPVRDPHGPPVGDLSQQESLSAFLDRRLAEARYLLLPNRSRTYAASKRIVDVVLSLALLIIFAPLIAALVVIIRLDSPGPAIFSQDRVTIGGRIFRFYKFRTMFADARERFPHLYDYRLTRDEFETAFYKLADDPRNTRVGRWLRRTTLDELPNLFNVLRGDLSMVGPRPDLPAFVRLYRPEEMCCLFTKAGLTGVAQVAGRSLLTVRERLTLDMRYVAQQTLALDLRILWRTVVVVLSGRGAF